MYLESLPGQALASVYSLLSNRNIVPDAEEFYSTTRHTICRTRHRSMLQSVTSLVINREVSVSAFGVVLATEVSDHCSMVLGLKGSTYATCHQPNELVTENGNSEPKWYFAAL